MVIRPGIELRSPQIQRDPYPHYKKMRADYRVCLLEDGQYALTRWEDVTLALSRADLFSSGIEVITAAEWLAPDCRRSLFILSMDPPEHAEYRLPVSRAFVGEVIQSLVPVMRDNAQRYIQHIKDHGEVEFVNEFAYPYIDSIIGRLNVSGESQSLAEIKRNVELRELLTPQRPEGGLVSQVEASIREQNAYFDRIFADRRKNPRSDLATTLLNVRIDGRPLAENELRDALDLFIAAGFHTTAQLLASAIVYLSRMPVLFHDLKAGSKSIPAFIEELLRFDGPTHRVIRLATRDVKFGDFVIPKGACVSVVIAAANHDPSQFANPDHFDIDRPNNKRHLQFGHGVHVCIGAALARMELKVALEEIVAAFETIRCTPDDELEYIGTITTRGLRCLMVSGDFR